MSDTNGSINGAGSRIIGRTKVLADATNWGPSVHGIRLTIVATNTSFPVGSESILLAVITNSSTNSIQVLRMGLERGFYVSATNASGKSYILREPLPGSRYSVPLNPGDKTGCEISISFETNMEPGDYIVSGFTSVSGYDLVSNPLKLQVK